MMILKNITDEGKKIIINAINGAEKVHVAREIVENRHYTWVDQIVYFDKNDKTYSMYVESNGTVDKPVYAVMPTGYGVRYCKPDIFIRYFVDDNNEDEEEDDFF